MIDNRTLADVETAKTLRGLLQAGNTLTNEQITALERGSCTINMLNRVEMKQAELAVILSGYAYMVHIENKTNWQTSDIFTFQEHQRLLNNLDILKQAYYIYSTTPKTPTYMYGYEEANSIEKILVDIENMIADMASRFRECGTFECGEVNNL